MDRLADVDCLVWDDWNTTHIVERHQMTPEQVEEIFAGDPIARETYKHRLLVLGLTKAGRMLAVVIGPVPDQAGAYYTFSARPASRRERRLYEQTKGSDKQ